MHASWACPEVVYRTKILLFQSMCDLLIGNKGLPYATHVIYGVIHDIIFVKR